MEPASSEVSLCHSEARHAMNHALALQTEVTHVASHISLANASLTVMSNLGLGKKRTIHPVQKENIHSSPGYYPKGFIPKSK